MYVLKRFRKKSNFYQRFSYHVRISKRRVRERQIRRIVDVARGQLFDRRLGGLCLLQSLDQLLLERLQDRQRRRVRRYLLVRREGQIFAREFAFVDAVDVAIRRLRNKRRFFRFNKQNIQYFNERKMNSWEYRSPEDFHFHLTILTGRTC